MDRIMGLEHEYGIWHPELGELDKDMNESHFGVRVEAISEHVLNNVNQVQVYDHSERHLNNGGKLYLDGTHLESATPECMNAHQLVAYDVAMNELLKEAADQTEVHLFKNNRSENNRFYGCHMNLSCLLSTKLNALATEYRDFIPFLSTQMLLTGSGHIHRDGFRLSQRAEAINRIFSNKFPTEERGIAHEKMHNYALGHARLHFTMADSNMSQTATLLKMGTLAAFVDMLEYSYEHPKIEIEEPHCAFHRINRLGLDANLKVRFDAQKAKTVSPLDVQETYLGLARKMYECQPEIADRDTPEILAHWESALTHLRRGEWRELPLDWTVKKGLLNKLRDASPQQKRKTSLLYHKVSEQGLYEQLRKKSIIPSLVSEQEVEHAYANPPPTRAKDRVNYIQSITSDEQIHVFWDRVCIGDGVHAYTQEEFPNPFGNKSYK